MIELVTCEYGRNVKPEPTPDAYFASLHSPRSVPVDRIGEMLAVVISAPFAGRNSEAIIPEVEAEIGRRMKAHAVAGGHMGRLPQSLVLTTGKDGGKYRTGRNIGHENRERVLSAIGNGWTSVPDVAQAIGLSDHNTRKWFGKLEKEGAIEIRRVAVNSNRSNIFGRVKREAAA